MNTRTRRIILRLIVGLLTFAIGVAATVALGGFRPFQGFDGSSSYRYKSYRRYKNWSPPPASEFGPDVERVYPSCPAKKARERMNEAPPLSEAPVPPALVR